MPDRGCTPGEEKGFPLIFPDPTIGIQPILIHLFRMAMVNASYIFNNIKGLYKVGTTTFNKTSNSTQCIVTCIQVMARPEGVIHPKVQSKFSHGFSVYDIMVTLGKGMMSYRGKFKIKLCTPILEIDDK